MRDPDLVMRAERAAIALERAWGHWRVMHGLDTGDPLPPVTSYVGYSLEEPWGQPRVVFGVAAEEAERLAALLEGHDCVGPVHAELTAGQTGGGLRQAVRQPSAEHAPARLSSASASAATIGPVSERLWGRPARWGRHGDRAGPGGGRKAGRCGSGEPRERAAVMRRGWDAGWRRASARPSRSRPRRTAEPTAAVKLATRSRSRRSTPGSRALSRGSAASRAARQVQPARVPQNAAATTVPELRPASEGPVISEAARRGAD